MELMNINLLVQEFYAIEAVSAMLSAKGYGCFDPARRSHALWYSDFMEFRSNFSAKLASAIYDYTALVVAAELRHAREKAAYYLTGYYPDTMDRDKVYTECTEYDPQDILKTGRKMFDAGWNEWDSSYGGDRWRQIAKAGLMKSSVSDCIFIDHCVDLSHNNNHYLDKGAGIFSPLNPWNYKEFLNFKRCCEPSALIKGRSGYLLNKLLLRAHNLGVLQDCKPERLFLADFDREEDLLLNYQPVKWGAKRLFCTERNIVNNTNFGSDDMERDEYDDRDSYAKAA